jgi:hypothetical protein
MEGYENQRQNMRLFLNREQTDLQIALVFQKKQAQQIELIEFLWRARPF